MDRAKNAEVYFHKHIGNLIDDSYLSGCTEDKLTERKLCLQGALTYAKFIGDIDSAYYRIFSDMLDGLVSDIQQRCK